MQSQTINSGILLLAASVWGLLWLPLRHVESLGVVGHWSVIAVNSWPLLICLPLMAWQWKALKPCIKQCLLFGLFSGAGLGMYAMGLVYSSVIRATMLFYLTPVWSMLAAYLILREPTAWQSWLTILCGFAGLILMLSGGNEHSVPFNIGDIFALVSGVCWALAVVVLRRHPNLPPLGTTGCQFAVASIVPLLLGWLILDNPQTPDLQQWLEAGIVLGAFSICILLPSLLVIFKLAGTLPPVRVGILMMSEVAVAMLTAALLTNELMGAIEWLGASLILAAAVAEVLIPVKENRSSVT
ncbi:MAG: drug/metabolite transporter (DMT)-like permease [Parasphingorhabdus sp.]|jgi:drug/metabolite transporter (DMT)-like permease